MPGPEFFETVMGHAYYEHHFPELVKQIKRLNDNLEKLIESQMVSPRPDVPPMPVCPEQCAACGNEEFIKVLEGWLCEKCGDLA
jgi:hypothetical protein